ncbi:MAG: reverse transcriptase domain-containing protein [Candidatus Hydrogenedentota bacterium]
MERAYVAKPGSKEERLLGIPTVRGRVVQTALRNGLEPIYERHFAEHSYGFRPGRGCKDALRRLEMLLRSGHSHVVDADIKDYFDSIPHDKRMTLVKRRMADGKVLTLVKAFLEQGAFAKGAVLLLPMFCFLRASCEQAKRD